MVRHRSGRADDRSRPAARERAASRGPHRRGHGRRPPAAAGRHNLLGPGPGNLAFRFSAVTLLEPHKSLHRYRLEGFDQAWVEAGARREAYYTNIPPGSYRFHVQGSNADGVWNQEGDVIAAAAAAALLPDRLVLRRRGPAGRWARWCCCGGSGCAGCAAEYLGALAERARVARELHDTLLQGMSAAALKLRGLRRRHSADRGDGASELASIDSLVDHRPAGDPPVPGRPARARADRATWRWRWNGWRSQADGKPGHRLRGGGGGDSAGRCPTTSRATCSASPRRRSTTPSSTPRPSASR